MQMLQGQKRMAPGHAGTGIAHDRYDLCSYFRLETMDGTVRAGRFVCSEGTFSDPLRSIISQLFAVFTDHRSAMVILTIEFDHQLNGFSFPIHHDIGDSQISGFRPWRHAMETACQTTPESAVKASIKRKKYRFLL